MHFKVKATILYLVVGGYMEEKRGLATYFTGVVRLIVFIILIIVLIVFVVRWASNRRAERKAEEVVKTAQESKKEKLENDTKEVDAAEDTVIETDGGRVAQVPSGVAESEATAPVDQRVPNTGIGENTLLSALGLSVTVYLFAINRQSLKQLKSLS